MKLDKLAEGLRAVMHKFDIDATDLLLLNDILTLKKERGERTIMETIEASKLASPATIHARIKKLTARKLLVKVIDESNLRYKRLETGPAYESLVELLSEV